MFNCISLEGRLVRDPELKKSRSGISICNITIACDRSVKRDGKEALFLPCAFFGSTAENVAKYFNKGKAIIVSGRLENDTIEDPSIPGTKKTIFYLDGKSFDFPLNCGNRKSDGVESPQADSVAAKDEPCEPIGSDPLAIQDEDLPF